MVILKRHHLTHPSGLSPFRLLWQQGWWAKFKSELPTRVERKKIVPLTIMFFSMLFSYTVLRDTKDVLVVTAPKSGTSY